MGVFVFKNASNQSYHRSKNRKLVSKKMSLLGKDFTDQLLYKSFAKTWFSIYEDIVQLHKESYTKTLDEVVDYVANAYTDNIDFTLPVAALLTGINQSDHLEQFENIKKIILSRLDANVIIIQSRDCCNIKSGIETMVRNFIESCQIDQSDNSGLSKILKSQCTMQTLENWYINQCPGNERLLIIILPDFECFNTEVLQDFILILNSYCNRIPIVLIFGVATSISAVHNSLSYNVTSKIKLKLFQTTSAICALNKIFDEVILSPKYYFNLSGKVLKFLNDVFLFYDFSINGFVQEFKYCLLEHFLQGNVYSLCTDYEESIEHLKYLTHDDFEILRQLSSFRHFVENLNNPAKVLSVFVTSKYWLKILLKILKNCHIYFKVFRCFIVFLTSIVGDLPKSPLGKYKREIYSICMTTTVTDTIEFKDCWKMIEFLSKDEFISKLNRGVNETKEFVENHLNENNIDKECKNIIIEKLHIIQNLLKEVIEAATINNTSSNSNIHHHNISLELSNLNRFQLKEKLLQMSKEEVATTDFVKSIRKTLEYIKTEIIMKHLFPPQKCGVTFHELFTFSDINLIRKHMIGTPRAALHTALNDPHFYLQCDCCELDEPQSVKESLPDLSVAYKLHLECGKLINLYDWLQAFRSIVDYSEDENEQIDSNIQARFTRAVAELQFLGYIKTSKRKTDHVSRLTW